MSLTSGAFQGETPGLGAVSLAFTNLAIYELDGGHDKEEGGKREG
jgi:hypothetical protein